MAGNVWEWTSYYDPNNKPNGCYCSEYYVSNSDRATGTSEHPLTEFISQEGIDGNWSRNEGSGYCYPASEGSGRRSYGVASLERATNPDVFRAESSILSVGFIQCTRFSLRSPS